MNYTTSNRFAAPQSFITKGKQRLKQHVDTVFLNNGDEFEIELFNPTQNKVLAKIEINGKSIGNGIVLRPGERVFLERYFDEARKFLFETYVVNGNNEEVKSAIEKNGDVTVKFFSEYIPTSTVTLPYRQDWFIPTYNTPTYTNTPPFSTFTNLNNSGSIGSTLTTSNNAFYSSNTGGFSENKLNFNEQIIPAKKLKTSEVRHVETGRVEKGSKSDQSFTYDTTSFNTYSSWSNWWKIKPVSQKVLSREDLVTYCTECGAKRKKDSHKFCPNCGTKF